MLKKSYGLVWFILSLITFNLSVFGLGKILKVYKKGAWYTKWYYWVLGVFCGIIPALIMLIIFNIQITNRVCYKLDVPGYEIYNYPYVWLLGLIIPFIGWAIFIILLIYTRLWYCIKILEGKGENLKGDIDA